jgi:spore coat protein CotH
MPPPVDDGRELHRNTFGMDLPWAFGAFQFEGTVFPRVGIRYKGNGTIADASRTIKKSLKIDLDRFDDAARYHGMKTLNLHSGVADPSKCRETLGYSIYRAAGVPAPQTTLAEVRLTVEGKFDNELLGIYTIVEDVDAGFLRNHFGTQKGLLLKPEGVRELEHSGDDWAAYDRRYKPKRTPNAKEARQLIDFVKLVQQADDDTFAREIFNRLDVPAFLRFLAATAFISNSDSFFVLGHNYYMYLHPETGKLHFIPWDVDRAFSNLPILGPNEQQMDLSFRHPYGGHHKLTDRLLAIPSVKADYEALLVELQKSAFNRERLLAELQEIEAARAAVLAEDLKAAENRKEGPGGFGPPGMFGKPPELTQFIEKRTKSLAAQIDGATGYIPQGGFGPGQFKPGQFLAHPFLLYCDTDKDERLSRQEWAAAATTLFEKSPKQPDDTVTEKDLTAGLISLFPKPPEGAQPPPGPPRPNPGDFLGKAIFNRADADKNEKVTRDELMQAAEAVFDKFDKDQAGSIDEKAFADLLNELIPAPPFGGPPRPPGAPPKPEEQR